MAGKQRGAYNRRGERRFTREELRERDTTNRLLWGRRMRRSIDSFFEARGIPCDPVSDAFVVGDED